MNEWIPLFDCQTQIAIRKITKWGHYNLNYTTIIIKNTYRIDKTNYMCRIIIDQKPKYKIDKIAKKKPKCEDGSEKNCLQEHLNASIWKFT